MTVKIKKIKIEIDGKILDLTKEQAIQLKGILEDMYGQKEVVYPVYPSPTWPWPRSTWYYDQWTYTTNDTADTLHLTVT